MVKVVVTRFGNVEDVEVHWVLEVMRECYERFAHHDVLVVDLYLFEGASLFESFLMVEHEDMGALTPGSAGSFIATHDAWRGTPRIALCMQKLRGLPEPVKLGVIRHEVAHTVLHGGIERYLLLVPEPLLALGDRFNISMNQLKALLYFVSIAVKDYEVTKSLCERGYRDDQAAYVEHLLEPSEEDRLAWILSRGKPLFEALCLTSLLKVVGSAYPLLRDGIHGARIEAKLREWLRSVVGEMSSPLLESSERIFPVLGADTEANVWSAVSGLMPLLQGLFRAPPGRSHFWAWGTT